ncbi:MULTISPECIES: cell division protein ZipA [unclassified Lysobacter]|uniref:cell division protein ZipA n=1 Tax=unclassified Lysobacter TaxID=2635362 RepID=UPI001BE6B5DE|nr:MULTISPECIES: cell division protein ZipA [unclassified Lysobacter]MBT2748001.1 cell division protein ZipA [Lysobacter sp. ISL-42]MBT2752787.1 cell division protein ZipA [Lysobacter sp. ISL-50]MBT2779375.1 cell division protein ZipA [Lysobacter sp. ISL-54]MBT2781862.1 cell division protein ZipA [Lysobacter sp. ISL-52]
MSDVTLMRIGILIAGLILIGAIVFFGRPRKPGQGKRVAREDESRAGERKPGPRQEPTLGEQIENELGQSGVPGEATTQAELELFDKTLEGGVNAANSELGRRVSEEFDKIVTLYLAARAGQKLHGPDIVVAAEKAGLVYGHMGVFHRLVEGHPERGPVFSVANIMKPGSFDMATIQSLETPAVAFFLTLPAPVPALDAWETMLPTAQRMAELLDAVVLDEQRNALGRQRIAHLRDELRAYDRQREAPPLSKPTRW